MGIASEIGSAADVCFVTKDIIRLAVRLVLANPSSMTHVNTPRGRQTSLSLKHAGPSLRQQQIVSTRKTAGTPCLAGETGGTGGTTKTHKKRHLEFLQRPLHENRPQNRSNYSNRQQQIWDDGSPIKNQPPLETDSRRIPTRPLRKKTFTIKQPALPPNTLHLGEFKTIRFLQNKVLTLSSLHSPQS